MYGLVSASNWASVLVGYFPTCLIIPLVGFPFGSCFANSKVKLTLDPLMFRLNAKTIGATIYYLNRPIELEHIKTKI